LEDELRHVVIAGDAGSTEKTKQDGAVEHRERLRYGSDASK